VVDDERIRSVRGLFFLSHHPVVAVVVIALVVAFTYYQNQNRR
jgi:hypothetical protein